MATTYIAAQDEMFAAIQAVFDGDATTILGYAPDVRYPGVPKAASPNMSQLWARVSLQTITDGQATLANAFQLSLFQADGLLFVQLFCPRNVGGSLDQGKQIAAKLQAVLRKQSADNEVWYMQAKIVELPETDENYPILVSARYQYKTLSQVA